jgi:formylglycine-generating enzyme required for sulfatase activity
MALPEVVDVPGGCFSMGSTTGRPDEVPVHDVDVRPFALSRTPVTNAMYAPFLATERAAPPPWWTHPAFAAPQQPVVGVTWFEAVAFTEWLSERTGGRWRLPTEAEWERAARGGLPGAATAWGEALPPGEVPDCALAGPWPVGRGMRNGFGLLDAGTVVHEWCLDWYREDFYAVSPAVEPCGPEEGERRSSRGGSWRHLVRWSSPAARSSLPPGFRYADYGFRVLKELRQVLSSSPALAPK